MNEINEVIWAGKPKQGIIFSSRDIFLIPFSLVWCGFAIFWTISATSFGSPSFFTLWGMMFVGVGLYLVVGRFFHDAIKRSRIKYIITPESVIIKSNSQVVIPIGQWACLKMEKYADSTGTISFGEDRRNYSDRGFEAWSQIDDKIPQFFRIDEPDRVLKILMDLNDKGKGN